MCESILNGVQYIEKYHDRKQECTLTQQNNNRIEVLKGNLAIALPEICLKSVVGVL